MGGCGSSAGKWTEHELKESKKSYLLYNLGQITFSEPHFSHLHKRDNGLLDGFNYRHGWMCLNKRSSSLIRPFCLTLHDLHHCTLWCFVVAVRNACINLCTPHYPIPMNTCALFQFLCLCLCVSHIHTHTYTYTLVFLFWSTVAYLPCSLYNLVGFATRKVILNLRIVVPNKGTVTFLIVCVSWHPIFPWPSGYNIKVAMKAIDSMLYPLPSVQLKAKYTGSNWRENLLCVLIG